jgi:hypothetical protein
MTLALELLDVIDRGIPNKERVPIKVNSDYYLANAWVGIGIKTSEDKIFPLNDNSLWLGMGWVRPGDWIFAYTGSGKPNVEDVPGSNSKIYTIFWNRPKVVFVSEEIHPYLLEGDITLPPSFKINDNFSKLLEFLSKPAPSND